MLLVKTIIRMMEKQQEHWVYMAETDPGVGNSPGEMALFS